MWLDGLATVASSADMDGESCRFIGQPSQLVHPFDSSYLILMVGHPKSMNLMMLTMVMVVVVVIEEEEEEDGREGRILWRGMRGSKFQANIVRKPVTCGLARLQCSLVQQAAAGYLLPSI